MTPSYVYNVSLYGNTTASYKIWKSKTPSKNYLIFFPGRGEVLVGTATQAKLDLTDKNGPTRYFNSGYEVPYNVVCVQAYHSTTGGSATFNTITRYFLHYIEQYYDVDKMVVTGLSLGGQEVYNVQLKALDIKLFEGAVAVCGRPDSYSTANPCSMKDVPMLAFHGDMDRTVEYKHDTTWIGKVNRCPGRINKIKLITYKGVAHDAWTKAYALDSEFWPFVGEILKNPEPAENIDDFKSKAIEAITNIK